MNNYQQIASILERSSRILIAGHVNPDGDCIGSALAMGLTLEGLGKQVEWVCDDTLPEIFSFLPGYKRYKASHQVESWETVVLVDCSDLARVTPGMQALAEKAQVLINIDHHISNQGFGHYQLIEPTAAATGEIIFRLIKQLAVPISLPLATNLYTAIVTDTGSFKYENTTETTHLIVAELLRTGLKPAQVVRQLYDETPYQALEVIKLGLNNLQLSDDGKVAWVSVSQQELSRIGAQDEHTDGLINYARMIKGVEVALLFRELSETMVKVSLRSKNRVDVNSLAGKFNGGGHPRAAGCRIALPLAQATKEMVNSAIKAVAATT